eukprot:1159682-Pelagomonas_calceolata.AAC.10
MHGRHRAPPPATALATAPPRHRCRTTPPPEARNQPGSQTQTAASKSLRSSAVSYKAEILDSCLEKSAVLRDQTNNSSSWRIRFQHFRVWCSRFWSEEQHQHNHHLHKFNKGLTSFALDNL